MMRSVPKGTLRRPPRSSSVGFSASEPPDSGPVLLPAPQYEVRKISVPVHKRVQAEMEVEAFAIANSFPPFLVLAHKSLHEQRPVGRFLLGHLGRRWRPSFFGCPNLDP